jgi:hypothetical protein
MDLRGTFNTQTIANRISGELNKEKNFMHCSWWAKVTLGK